eukprot:TRINITY_DN24598_c0_g1_i1.p2 TRINITY_DN24598_c0_g1~~TRINITY_DN24598_c0_g1_i1.p2  ORF type:complete len:167 (-),score=54.24 TRINITY_DN24598_c0_g1_i1:3-503(-)
MLRFHLIQSVEPMHEMERCDQKICHKKVETLRAAADVVAEVRRLGAEIDEMVLVGWPRKELEQSGLAKKTSWNRGDLVYSEGKVGVVSNVDPGIEVIKIQYFDGSVNRNHWKGGRADESWPAFELRFSADYSERAHDVDPVSYTHLRAHETPEHLVCRLLLEKKKQ